LWPEVRSVRKGSTRMRSSHAAVWAVASLALLAIPCQAQVQSDSLARGVQPELRWQVEATLLGAGAALFAVGSGLTITRRVVPPEGLDPSDVAWSLDRRVTGQRSTSADVQSDNFRDAALVYPVVLAFVSQPSGTRVSGTLRRTVMYVEAVAIAEGLSTLIKGSADRPRPFNYLPAGQRPDNPAYDVTVDDAFRSMPSGHATSTFCAAGFAITDYLISRPDAGWKGRFGSAFVGGFLAGGTASLRVEGGQHFPTDVMAGGLIGTVTGVGVPLVHRYIGPAAQRAALPTGRAWKQAFLGWSLGVALSILLAKTY